MARTAQRRGSTLSGVAGALRDLCFGVFWPGGEPGVCGVVVPRASVVSGIFVGLAVRAVVGRVVLVGCGFLVMRRECAGALTAP
jgi:hypothetical protein